MASTPLRNNDLCCVNTGLQREVQCLDRVKKNIPYGGLMLPDHLNSLRYGKKKKGFGAMGSVDVAQLLSSYLFLCLG